MSYSLSMLVAIVIHIGSFLGIAAFSSAQSKVVLPSQRVVSAAQIIHVTSVKSSTSAPKPKSKAKILEKVPSEKTIPIPSQEQEKEPELAQKENESENEDVPSSSFETARAGEHDAADAIPTIEGSAANYRHNPNPNYPQLSVRMREEGKVFVKALVNKDGKVERCELMKSSGFERLDKSALDAVKQWLFIAQQRNGEAIASWVIVPVNFKLKT